MPGHLGNVNRTIQNLTIVKIIPEENVMLVKGSIPGHKGSVVIIKPTEKKYTAKVIYSDGEVTEASTAQDQVVETSKTESENSTPESKTETVEESASSKDTVAKEDGKNE